jgi:hypothetical protein
MESSLCLSPRDPSVLLRPNQDKRPFCSDLMTFQFVFVGFKYVPVGKYSIECNFLETKIAGLTGEMNFSLDINEDEA